MNIVEKVGVKLTWRKYMKIPSIRRWAPLAAVVFLVVHTLAQSLGYHKADETLSQIAEAVPVEQQSPIPAEDVADAVAKLVAAVTALTGVALKLRGVIALAMESKGDSAGGGTGVARMLVFLLLLPTPSKAQSADLTLYGGAMQFMEKGQPDKRDFVSRLTLNIKAPSSITISARVDWTRTQDGGDLFDIQTFRSVEAFGGARKDVGGGFAPLVFSGVTWNRDSDIQPTDPRMWTLAGGMRFEVNKKGYIIAAVGHHGPVGGPAFLGSVVVYLREDAAWFADIAVPLNAEQFAIKPVTLKAGFSVKIWDKHL